MKLSKDRGNFSNLVSESLLYSGIIAFTRILLCNYSQLSLSLSLSANRIILCSKQQDIGSIDAPYKRYFQKVNVGVECCTADIPIRVNTSFFARIHKRQVVSDTFGDGALEGTTLVSYDDKSISVERFILTLQKQADKLARGTPNFSSKILRGI